MTRKQVMPTKEEHWNIPTDECWDSSVAAQSGSQATAHLKQTKKSWVLTTPPKSIDTSKRRMSSRSKSSKKETIRTNATTTPFAALTPATAQSTPPEHTTTSNSSSSAPLSETYVEMIAHAFGSKADLYQDVLGITRDASPRAVRIAYFKRGRQVLSSEHAGNHASSATISGHISDLARLRFQAVSMAYEIVSTPHWLDAYERCRLITEDDKDEDSDSYDDYDTPDALLSDPSISSTKSLASSPGPTLRSSSSNGSLQSRKTHTGVRWNEEVEELVFNLDPEEHIRKKKEKKKSKKKKKKHKKKKRIAVETSDVNLEKHLEKLDKEAEQTFLPDFLDDLEQSIDHLLSSSFGGDEKLDPDEGSEEGSDEEVAGISKELFPELKDDDDELPSLEENLATPKLSMKKQTKQVVPNAPKKKHHHQRKLDTSDIEDDEFERYKKFHQQRQHSKAAAAAAKNHFEVGHDDLDARQEEVAAADGSQPSFDVARREQAFTANDGDDEDSHVSFSEIKGGDPTAIRATQSYDAAPPHSPKGSVAGSSTRSAPAQHSPRRGQSAWHSSPHSPKQQSDTRTAHWHSHHSPKRAASMDKYLSSGYQQEAPSTPDRNISMQNNLMFASPDGEQARVGGGDLPFVMEEQTPLTPPLSPRSPKRSPRRLTTRTRSKSKEKKQFRAPADIAVSKNYERKSFDDDGDSAAYTVDDSVSTLSASVVQRHINRDLTNSRYKEGLEKDKTQQQQLMEQVKEEEGPESKMDRLNTSIDAVLQGTTGGGTTSTAPSTPARQQQQQLNNSITAAATTEFVEISPTTNPQVDASSLFCFGFCGDEDLAETARAAATAQGSPDDPSFTAFLMVYLNAMASDLARLGHSIQENLGSFEVMQSVEISENDLDGMLTILESEMEDVPEVAKTLSQEFLPSPSYAEGTAASPHSL